MLYFTIFLGPEFVDLGPGCCTQDTWLFNQEIEGDFNGKKCFQKCVDFGYDKCGFIEHGWKDSTHCSIVEKYSPCRPLDSSENGCGSHGNNGVHTYKYIGTHCNFHINRYFF